MAVQSPSPTLLLMCRTLSAQSSSVFHEMSLTAFRLYEMRISFNHPMYFMLSESACTLLWLNFHAFYPFCSYFITLSLVFPKFLKPNKQFILEIKSDVCDGVTGSN
jgi:hypothetical protein